MSSSGTSCHLLHLAALVRHNLFVYSEPGLTILSFTASHDVLIYPKCRNNSSNRFYDVFTAFILATLVPTPPDVSKMVVRGGISIYWMAGNSRVSVQRLMNPKNAYSIDYSIDFMEPAQKYD